MTVNTIASIAATIARSQGNTTAKAASVFNSLFTPASKSTAKDSTNFSAAITLQNQVAQFRVASKNIAQSSSLLAATEAGISAINKDIARLKDIATRASSSSLSDNERAALASEFQIIRARIDRTAQSAKFNNESLLDGSSPQLRIAQENKNLKDLSIGSLKDDALFKGKTIAIGTPAGAKAAEAIVKEAQAYANAQLDNIRALQTGLEFASSTLESAIQNQDATRSTLTEADFTAQLLNGGRASVGNDAASLIAQTNRLPSNLLSLLSD